MKEIENILLKTISKEVLPILNTENLIVEAVHSLIKDEIKRYIRAKLYADEKLKKELKETVELYVEAKFKEVYYAMKMAKTGAKLGLNLIPEKLKTQISEEITRILEKEVGQILEKSF
ncbi:MAG TPA: hypothetical protein EYP29_00580 [Thermoplasmata archaeon]|nr:hypothetical protein [Thermoplasmata archaeon]